MPLPFTDEEILSLNLIEELGLGPLPNEEKVKLIEQFAEMVQKQVMVRAFDLLTEEDGIALDAIVQKHGDQSSEFFAFIKEKIPNLPEMFIEEATAAKRKILETIVVPPATPPLQS